MLQLAYYSRNRTDGGDRALDVPRDILRQSQLNNSRDELTGFLVFDRTWFMQVLEGDALKVRATFNRIQLDPRHADLVVTSQIRIATRTFPDWAMEGTRRDPDSEEVFIRHGLDQNFDPRRLTSSTIVALARDLARSGRAKRLALRPAASPVPMHA